jgi:phosphatidylcholine synthase
MTSPTRRILAWGVHLFTASGLICLLLAMRAGVNSDWRLAFAWLAVATLIDGVDGVLARRVGVKQVLPGFDGTLLDNVIDFVGYVFVPAFFLYQAQLLPSPCAIGTAAAVCIASGFQFCQADAKTADHYFKGFPSYWNVVVLYLLAMRLSVLANLAIVALLIVLVFVPVKYVYPSRTREFRVPTLVLTALWGALMIGIIVQLPEPPAWLIWTSLAYVAYYLGMSLHLTFKTRGKSAGTRGGPEDRSIG